MDQLTSTFQLSLSQMSWLILSEIALNSHISYMRNHVIFINSKILFSGIFRMYIHMCMIYLQYIYYLQVLVNAYVCPDL